MNNGVLIIPVGYNGESMKNVICVLTSPKVVKKYGLPKIGTITFLCPEEVTKVKLREVEYAPNMAYRNIIKELDLKDIEMREREVAEGQYSKVIPDTIFRAVKEVGRENIILDLTCGKKDVTGLLYTAATISQIDNMAYIEVQRDSNGAFYELKPDDEDILDKFEMTRFQSMEDIEKLASQNEMEFVFYKKMVDEVFSDAEDLRGERLNFNSAIEYYFLSQNGKPNKLIDCIRNIGNINEQQTLDLNKKLKENCPQGGVLEKKRIKDDADNKPDPNKFIEDCSKHYGFLSKEEDKRTLSEKEKEELEFLKKIFEDCPGLYYMMRAVRCFRNRVSHNTDAEFAPEDAKLMIDMELRIVRAVRNFNPEEE